MEYSMKACILVFGILIFLGALQLSPSAVAQPSVTDIVFALCNTAIFTTNDSFAQNLAAVASTLTQNSSQVRYSLASSETGSQSNFVHGMYQCRGDVSLSDCTSCVVSALSGLQRGSVCGSLSRGVRVQYTGCFLRYESYVFSDTFEMGYALQPTCTGSSNDSSRLYKQNLGSALNESAIAAPQHALFGYNASSVGSGSDTAYALTQCLGYINESECATCLSQVSNYSSACNQSISGGVYFVDCYYLFGNTPLVFTYNNISPPTTNSTDVAFSPAPTAMAIPPSGGNKNHKAIIIGIVVGTCVVFGIIAIVAIRVLNRRKESVKEGENIGRAEDPLLLQACELLATPGAKRFSVKELQDATNNFHPSNKLGQGGFGPVYQGRLKSGIEVAIKMLSAESRQGTSEFLNEVNLITTVQHRNLIQLIGCCVEEDNKHMLVYEYLPNRSLDLHLFDANKDNVLDWSTRFELVVGIARGLKYLHEESSIRIIHRDIKASNILLDENMNPKIADFGLARLFSDDISHLTTRVVGTLGYLAPEYAINGQLTEKADVYSFGLVTLEIVSGRRVVENKFEENNQNLLDWTWTLYEKQQQLQIVDKRMENTNVGEAIRVVHVALLCTQLQPQMRPSMSEVHNMLCSKSEILNIPTKPITIGMLSPLANIFQDSNSELPSSSTPSWNSKPTYSYNAESISQVVPR